MGHSLSQREIDVLLHGTPSRPGAGLADDITAYDFARPRRISRDRRVVLESIFNRFALSLQALLSSRLRANTDIGLKSLEQANYSEFILSLASPCAAYVFDVGGGHGGRAVIDISTEVAFYLVDRLFGGSGDAVSMERPLTPLEQSVVRGMADRLLGTLRDAWEDVAEMTPQILGFESNPELLHVVAGREEPVLNASLEITSGAFSGFITLCLPVHTLEPLLAGTSAMAPAAASRRGEERVQRERLEAALRHVHVAVVATLPALRVPARDLLALHVGQVLPTGQPADAAVEVAVNGRRRFSGSLGRSGQRLGIRIQKVLRGPEGESALRTHEGRVV